MMKEGVVKVIEVFKSDKGAYTQGLEIDDNGVIYHATGLHGKSGLGILNKELGKLHYIIKLPQEFFGEGITITPKGIWQLTYKEKTAFFRDKMTLRVLKTVSYDTEGWGLAYDKENGYLLMCDGTDEIFIRDADTFEVLDSFKISENGEKIELINELEYADGFLYANIWKTFDIIKIDLKSRKIVSRYNFEEIIKNLDISEEDREQMNVLNGIAHIDKNRFYITGKMYPVLLEVKLN